MGCRADPQFCSLVTWFPTPRSWGHESYSFLHRLGLARSGLWPASRIQKRAGGCQWRGSKSGRGWEQGCRLEAVGLSLSCWLSQASGQIPAVSQGRGMLEGQGLSRPL